MTIPLWALLALGAAAAQTIRNAAQRNLIDTVGLYGATWVRFLYGLPFGILWLCALLALREPSGGLITPPFVLWAAGGALTQGAATVALLVAMRSRAFAIATALQKTEVLGAALLGIVLIADTISGLGWLGIILGTLGVLLAGGGANVPITERAATVRAGLFGAVAGLGFAFSSVAYRAAAQNWTGDTWVGAGIALVVALLVQTILGGIFLVRFDTDAIGKVMAAWRRSLLPGFTGALASAFWFTSFALAPSAAAVKTVGLVDVLFAWIVSRRLLKERLSTLEIIGAALIILGAGGVLLEG
mgnify:CR=1 FL=1